MEDLLQDVFRATVTGIQTLAIRNQVIFPVFVVPSQLGDCEPLSRVDNPEQKKVLIDYCFLSLGQAGM